MMWSRRGLRPEIASCLADADRPAHYDRNALGYDLLISSAVYHRPAWGAWPSCHAEAARMALADCPSGPILDAGCGSLLFTADVYRTVGRTEMICLDRSLGMLRRGQRRMPAGQFWHGGALALPFRMTCSVRRLLGHGPRPGYAVWPTRRIAPGHPTRWAGRDLHSGAQ